MKPSAPTSEQFFAVLISAIRGFMPPVAVDVLRDELLSEFQAALRKDPHVRFRFEVSFQPFEFDYEILGPDDDDEPISMGGFWKGG